MAKGAKTVAKSKAAGVAASTGKSRKAAADEPFSGHEGLAEHEVEAVKIYQGLQYRAINNHLRDVGGGIPPDIAKHIPTLEKLTSNSTINRDVTLYRGFGFDVGTDPRSLIGATIGDKGFASSSLSFDKAKEFGSLVVEFRAPKGTKGLAVHKVDTGSHLASEQEVLLPRYSNLKIKSIKKLSDGYYHAMAELTQ